MNHRSQRWPFYYVRGIISRAAGVAESCGFAANRAACHLKLENFGSAIADSSEAIKMVSGHVRRRPLGGPDIPPTRKFAWWQCDFCFLERPGLLRQPYFLQYID